MSNSTEDTGLAQAHTTQDALEPFDEGKFLRRVKARSIARAVLVTLVVTAVLFAAGVFAAYKWYSGTLEKANSIDWYYPDLVAISHPNTLLMGPSITRYHFPGASNDYVAYRTVGDRPLPAGDRVVDFDIWQPEYLRGSDQRSVVAGGRTFWGADLVPELRFLHPLSKMDMGEVDPEGATVREQLIESVKLESEAARQRLRSTPASYTVEVAVSFDSLLGLSDIEKLGGDEATLAWGAVNVWDAAEAPPVAPLYPGEIVGVPFQQAAWGTELQSSKEVQDGIIDRLREISKRTQIGTADKTMTSANYLAREGFGYYGAVFTGSPAQLERIVADPRVTAVSYGLCVAPWE